VPLEPWFWAERYTKSPLDIVKRRPTWPSLNSMGTLRFCCCESPKGVRLVMSIPLPLPLSADDFPKRDGASVADAPSAELTRVVVEVLRLDTAKVGATNARGWLRRTGSCVLMGSVVGGLWRWEGRRLGRQPGPHPSRGRELPAELLLKLLGIPHLPRARITPSVRSHSVSRIFLVTSSRRSSPVTANMMPSLP
jgi:hypothetical protein